MQSGGDDSPEFALSSSKAPRKSLGQRVFPCVLTGGVVERSASPFPRVRIGATSALRRPRSSRPPPRRAAAFFDAAMLAEPARGVSSAHPPATRPRAQGRGARNGGMSDVVERSETRESLLFVWVDWMMSSRHRRRRSPEAPSTLIPEIRSGRRGRLSTALNTFFVHGVINAECRKGFWEPCRTDAILETN